MLTISKQVLESSELHRATTGGPSPEYGGEKFNTSEELKKEIGPMEIYARSKLAAMLQAKVILLSILFDSG